MCKVLRSNEKEKFQVEKQEVRNTGGYPYTTDFIFNSKLRIKRPKIGNTAVVSILLNSPLTMVEATAADSDKEDLESRDSEEDDLAEFEDNTLKEGAVIEPYVGMEFESEDDARRFYNEYARKAGFVVRVMQRRRSEIDGTTLARRLGCNKQGFSPNTKAKNGPEKKPRPSAREGCKATILFKLEKSGKWVVTRFVKDHNHPLGITHEYRKVLDKDKRIQELARELQRQEELCASYRERLINLLDTVENQTEQMSSKVLAIVENVKKAEAEALSEAQMLSAL